MGLTFCVCDHPGGAVDEEIYDDVDNPNMPPPPPISR